MFQKLDSFTSKVSYLADKPNLSPTELKAQFDAAPEEVRQYLNGLIDALQKTESGDSGAKNIGVTSISGMTGNDAQTILENISSGKANRKQENWISAVLQNSWVNFGSPFETAAYMKDEMGFVHLKGMVKNGAIAQDIFVLPSGYRPGNQQLFSIRCSDGSADFSTTLDIRNWGSVLVASDAKNAWISLNGITFKAES